MAALVIAVGVLVIVVVATGGDDEGSAQNGQEEEEDNGDREAGELRLAGEEPITLDPHIAQDASSAIYIVEIFGGLLTIDPQLQLQPDLAAEIPTEENGGKAVNPDGTVTYRFTIREDALFHDRKPVTAETVKASLERSVDPATQSLVAEFFLGDIVGVSERIDGEAPDISGVQVIDNRTLEITIEEDIPSFLFKLTYPAAFVIDPSEVGNSNWTTNPNGTGPFELEEWRFGERIILEANENYHLGAPGVSRVRFLLAGSPITLYEQGEIDVTGVGVDDLTRVQDPNDPLNAEYRTGDRMIIDYIGFNTNSPPFDDPNVRRAFAMAVDREQIANAVLKDAVPVANSIMMPGLPAYDETAQTPPFDPEAARQLLEESEYGGAEGLPEIVFAESGTGATSGPGTLAILEMWRDNLGVEVEVTQAEAATFFQDIAAGRYQLFGLAWVMDYPLEDNLLNLHFDSESENNDTFYTNPEVDQLLRDARLETNEQQRIAMYREAEGIVLGESPWIPLFYGRFHALVKPYVQNYEIPAIVVPRLRYVELTPQ
jgi:ABC-type transport system substrate-binding protein